VHLNDITSLLSIMKIYQAVQKLVMGHTHTHTETDRQTCDLISLLYFLESGLKIHSVHCKYTVSPGLNLTAFIYKTLVSGSVNFSLLRC
jgi:hypothetical protein